MAPRRSEWLTLPAAAAILLWPAVWNRYPIVFADTGTYLSQAIHRYAGWDRPVFYSLFIFPLHAMRSLWPIVAAQALLTVWLLRRVCRLAAPHLSPAGFLLLIAGLALGTWLPWLVSEVMPDLFTPLLVLVLWVLAWQPRPLSPSEFIGYALLAAFMIATQQSSLPLSVAVIVAGMVARWRYGPTRSSSPAQAGPPRLWRRSRIDGADGGPSPAMPGWRDATTVARPLTRSARALALLLPPALAALGLCSVNLAAHGRFAVSPFGNVFLLARVLYDGPGLEVLRRDCPQAGWRLCDFRDAMPESSDAFLWTKASPLHRAGGPKQLTTEADSIIQASLRANPWGTARAALLNTADQMVRFASGDGLSAWPEQVTPTLASDFPAAEAARYAAARQQSGTLDIPVPLGWLHALLSLIGVAACVALLPSAWRRRMPAAGLLVAVLVALPVNAAVTGSLSGPHDRYQARLMWLPPFAATLVLTARRRPGA